MVDTPKTFLSLRKIETVINEESKSGRNFRIMFILPVQGLLQLNSKVFSFTRNYGYSYNNQKKENQPLNK